MINENFLKDLKENENICYLLDIFTENNHVFLTSSDTDIYIEDICYKSGYFLNIIGNDNLEDSNGKFILQLVNTDYINSLDEGIFNAKITIKLYTNKNTLTFFKGFVASIIKDGNEISLSISSNIQLLNRTTANLFSPLCRECLGSSKCGVNLENYKATGTITSIISADCFIGNHQEHLQRQIGYYTYGIVRFTSGKLQGISMQIKDENNGKIYLLKQTNMLSIGDKYEIFTGCDKTMKMCKEKFNNIVNFRGEPFINNTSK